MCQDYYLSINVLYIILLNNRNHITGLNWSCLLYSLFFVPTTKQEIIFRLHFLLFEDKTVEFKFKRIYKVTILVYIDGYRAFSVWFTLNFSPIIRRESIDSCKCFLLQC